MSFEARLAAAMERITAAVGALLVRAEDESRKARHNHWSADARQRVTRLEQLASSLEDTLA